MDGVIILNFLVDYLLFLGTNQLSGFPQDFKRLAAASALGAVYSGVCLIPSFRFMGSNIWRTVCFGCMCCIAFGWRIADLRRWGIFLLLSMALGGFALCFGKMDIHLLILSTGALWMLCRISFEAPPGSREYVPVEIRKGDQSVRLLALRDTGNTLRDPVTGESVLVIPPWAARKLTGLTDDQLQNPMETMMTPAGAGLRLIPFRTVGQGSGMMLAMRFSDVIVAGKSRSTIVAFSAEYFDRGTAYQALTGGATSW